MSMMNTSIASCTMRIRRLPVMRMERRAALAVSASSSSPAALSPPPAGDVQKKNFDDKIELRILIELQKHTSGKDID